MRVEILSQDNDVLSIRLFDELDVQELEKNAHNGRYFGYLDTWIKGTTTDAQRKHYWALVADIQEYTGYPKWEVIQLTEAIFHREKDSNKRPSVARNKQKLELTQEWLQMIIEWCIENQVPFRKNQEYVPADEGKYFFKLTMNRLCWICGQPESDLAHVEAVGSGRNRKSIDHTQHHVMTLCRKHHSEQHQIGIETFLSKYKLPAGIKLSEENLEELGI